MQISMIPGAISEQEFYKKKFSEGTVYVYCTIGLRSGQFISKMKNITTNKLQFVNLKGSILAWTYLKDSYLIDPKTGQKTKHIHVYGPTWSVARSDYIPHMFSVWKRQQLKLMSHWK